MSQPVKGPTEADFSAWTAENLILGKDFPMPCCLHSLLDSLRAQSLCNTQKQRTILPHSLSNGKKHYLQTKHVLSCHSHMSVHMEDVFIVQAWHHNHCQECNAAVYLECSVNTIVQLHDTVNISQPANPLCSTSIQLQFFNNCSKYQYLRYKPHGSICKTDRKFSKKLQKADFGATFYHVRSIWAGMEQHGPVRSICVQEWLSLWASSRCPPAGSAHSALSCSAEHTAASTPNNQCTATQKEVGTTFLRCDAT